LDPSICKDQWKESEDQLIIKSVKKSGTKWAAISKLLPGRTDNDVKNRWYSVLNRRKTNEINSKSPERKIERKSEQSSEIISLCSSVRLNLAGFHDNYFWEDDSLDYSLMDFQNHDFLGKHLPIRFGDYLFFDEKEKMNQ
jgi:hypothetical protein